jgi:hypothetical protein
MEVRSSAARSSLSTKLVKVLPLRNGLGSERHSGHLLEVRAEREERGHDPRPPVPIQW